MSQNPPVHQIYAAMQRVMSRIGHIGKDSKNTQQGFMFRGIDQVYNTLHSIMADEGVFTTSAILDKHREERTTKSGTVLAFVSLTIEYTFHAQDGSKVSTVVVGEGMDSGDKATNKAMAIAHKYALLQAFMVPTEQIDPDAESFEVAAKPENVQPAVPPKVTARFREIVEGEESVALAVFHNTRQALYVAAHGQYMDTVECGQKGKVRARIDAMLADGQKSLSRTLDEVLATLQNGDDARHLWADMSEAEAEWIFGQVPPDLLPLANEGRTAAKEAA